MEKIRIKNFNIRLIDFDYLCERKCFDFCPDRKFKDKVDISLWEIESWGNIEFLNFFYECDKADIKVNVICQNNFLPMASLVGHSCITTLSHDIYNRAPIANYQFNHGETNYCFQWRLLRDLPIGPHLLAFHRDLSGIVFNEWFMGPREGKLGYGHINHGKNIDIYNINNLSYEGMNSESDGEAPRKEDYIKWDDGHMNSTKLDLIKREGIRCCLPSEERVSELYKFYSSRPIYMSKQFFDEFISYKDRLPQNKIALEFKYQESPKTKERLRALDDQYNEGGDTFFVYRDIVKSVSQNWSQTYLSFQFLNCLFNNWRYLTLCGASSVTQAFYPINNLMFIDLANITISSSMLKKKLNMFFYGADPLAIKINANLQRESGYNMSDFFARDNIWKIVSDKIEGDFNGK